MSLRLLKTPAIFACFVLVIFLMRQNDFTPSKGLRHSMRLLTQRVLASGSRPSTTLCEGIITDESYSQSEIDKADSVDDSLSGTRGGNPLKDWVVDGSKDTFVDDYVIGLIPLIAPWPVLAIITLLTCIGFVTNWCCIFGCCKNCCKCCKCCHGPKEQGKLKIYMAISGLFLVGLLGSAAAGLSFAPKVAKGMNVTFCTALISMENLVHGETSESWLGFDGIITGLQNVQSQFTTTVNNLNAIGGTGGSTTNMDTAYTNAKNANSYLYTNNNGKTSPRADPSETTAYTTSYVANLGPVATADTYTYLIQAELDKWKTTINDATTNIDSSISSLSTNQVSIGNAISTGLDTAQSITDSLNDVVDSLGDNGDSIKNAVKGVGSGLTALFAVNLVFAIVALGSIGMIKFMKIKFFNKILHFSWCVIMLMTVLGFLIVTVTMPLGVVLIESCEVFKLTLTDEDFFNDVTDLLFSGGSSDTKSILHTCFYGSGLALDELGLTNDLGYFDTIYAELDKVNEIIPLSGTYTAANPPPSVVIPPQQTIVDNTLDGTLVDSTYTTTDLKNLNKVTNSAAYSCISLQDTWVLNSGSCVSGYTFLSSDGETKNVGSKVCIGFVDAWMDPSTKDIDLRYTTSKFPTSCTSPSLTTVKNFVHGFEANRNDIASDFGTIQTDLQDVADKQKLYSAEVLNFVNKIKQVQSDVAALKDSLVGEKNGVIPNTNCKFIGSDLRKLQVGMCATFASSIYQASVAMVVMSVFAFVATIFTFCLAKRFSLGIKKDSKVDPNKHQEMAKDDPFQDPFQSPTPN